MTKRRRKDAPPPAEVAPDPVEGHVQMVIRSLGVLADERGAAHDIPASCRAASGAQTVAVLWRLYQAAKAGK